MAAAIKVAGSLPSLGGKRGWRAATVGVCFKNRGRNEENVKAGSECQFKRFLQTPSCRTPVAHRAGLGSQLCRKVH